MVEKITNSMRKLKVILTAAKRKHKYANMTANCKSNITCVFAQIYNETTCDGAQIKTNCG